EREHADDEAHVRLPSPELGGVERHDRQQQLEPEIEEGRRQPEDRERAPHALAARVPHQRPRSARARATACSPVNPSSRLTLPPGADAPKRSTPTPAPPRPTQRSQPNVAPASTASRRVTVRGKTVSRYSADSDSNSSQDGMLTTRARMPSLA